MSESDKVKAIAALNLLQETCSANITPLDRPSSQDVSSQATPIATLHKDYLSLSTLIYTTTTRLSLVLKPSDPTFSASLRQIQDMITYVSSITTCATLFDSYGNTISKEARRLAKELCEAIRSLAQSFLVAASGTLTDEDDYLVRTGAIHEIVEKIRRDLPTDNFTAVKRKLMQDKEMIEDSVNEVNSMLDPDQEEYPFGDDEDEWDELGFGSTKKLSEAEIARVKKIQPLIRFLSLLHKRMLPDIIKPLHERDPGSPAKLDTFPSLSSSLLVCLEELVAVLYAPQNPSSIKSTISSLQDSVRLVQSTMEKEGFLLRPQPSVESIDSSLAAMSLGGQATTPKQEKDPAKWFETCFGQIYKVSTSISDSLDSEAINP